MPFITAVILSLFTLLFSSCSSGGGSSAPAAPAVKSAPEQIRGFGLMAVVIDNPNPTSTYEAEFDLGNGCIVRVKPVLTQLPSLWFVAPPGTLKTAKDTLFASAQVSWRLIHVTMQG